MPLFDYLATSSSGEEVAGTIDAPDEDAAISALKAKQIHVVRLDQRLRRQGNGLSDNLLRFGTGLE